MSTMRHAKGKLTIVNPAIMDGKIHDIIMRGAMENGIRLLVREIRKDGVILIDNSEAVTSKGNPGYELTDRFINFLNEVGVAELRLSGKVTVTTVPDGEPSILRITITDGVVAVEDAMLTWHRNITKY